MILNYTISELLVIFCNSSLQWFREPQKAVKNCHTALRKGGRIGIQAPAKRVYSPNFIGAIEKVKEDPRTKDIFAHFNEPWFLLEKEDEYTNLLEKTGFKIVFSKIKSIETKHTLQCIILNNPCFFCAPTVNNVLVKI